tara:strand:- start:1229 stop:2029 length:801 start_codon:yes stop_codon:yes gene_type:complete
MNEITIGYLSWKRRNILEQTLQSHQENGLFDILKPQNRIIFFQEISQQDINIAKTYELNILGNEENIGILNAFIELVKNCKTKYFIFCENDWLLIENKKMCEDVLNDCIQLLNKDQKNVIKLRHIKNPGNPLYSHPSNVHEWLNGKYHGFPYKLESLSWLDDPNKYYKSGVLNEIQYKYKWYSTTLEHQRWSNNIFIANTKFLKNTMVPMITNFKDTHKYLGLENILINYHSILGKNEQIDKYINEYKTLKVVAGMGLFTHKDKKV